MDLLKKLYCIHSKSKQEDKILEFLINWLFANVKEANVEMDKTGNLYVTKGESETYPCIVSHVDQVQTLHSDDFEAVETKDIIFGWSKKNKRYEGLGADDKNGVWIALQCLLKYDVLKAAFFVSEEIGCIGSDKADMSFFKDVRFVLQCDRRGFDDLITDASLTELCSDDFVKATNCEWFGYKEASGMMTDVMTLKENGLKVSCVNISCGYYEPHTDREFTIKYDLLNCLYLVEHIIENCTSVYPHEYVYKPKTTIYSGYNTGYGGYYDSNKKWHSTYKYGSTSSNCGNVSNSQTKEKTETTKEVEEKQAVNSIEKFWEDEYNDYTENDWADDFNNQENEPDVVSLNEDMRDELYDVIFALLNDCPSASYDMIRSAVLHTYSNINEKDLYAIYGEVRYDMKKYYSMA